VKIIPTFLAYESNKFSCERNLINNFFSKIKVAGAPLAPCFQNDLDQAAGVLAMKSQGARKQRA
jgi:hypothetical protein